MSVLPNSVGRLDDVVEAIREGDRERAIDLLSAERHRLEKKHSVAYEEQNKIYRAWLEMCKTIERLKPGGFEPDWEQLRKACGWSGVDGFEGPVETLPPVKPALRAEELPIGTVMVLGDREYALSGTRRSVFAFSGRKDKLLLWIDELQELIDRGVRFEIPEGGAK